jgi:DNA-binding winged helix-turn-helix (wHTH) protein
LTESWKKPGNSLEASAKAMNDPLLPFEFGAYRLDCANKRLLRGTEVIALTPKQFDTLQLLVENAPQLVEKDEFMRRLWPKTVVEESALAENVSRLRRALGESDTQRYIETQPKRGYRFVAPVVRAATAPALARIQISEPTRHSRISDAGVVC